MLVGTWKCAWALLYLYDYACFGALTIACLVARKRCWACTHFGVLLVPVGMGLTCCDPLLPAVVQDLIFRLLAATHLALL